MSPSEAPAKIRTASKNERRYITRHALGWYLALIVTGLYTIDKKSSVNLTSIDSYIPALKGCIDAHPILGTVIENEGSEAPEFVRPARLDLRKHITIIYPRSSSHNNVDEVELLRQVTMETHDQPWLDVNIVPPWRIVVLPLPDRGDELQHRAYILYAYSHTHGDGKSGLAFHNSLLQGLQAENSKYDESPICQAPRLLFPPPLEEACNLRVSWYFLLSTLFTPHLKWFKLLSTPQSTNPYVGNPMSHDPENFHTSSQILILDKDLVIQVLAACRAHNAKFTGLLNQIIVRALSQAMPPKIRAESFISQIVVDLRSMIPAYSDNTMGNCVSAIYEKSARFHGDLDDDAEAMWSAARKTTKKLAFAANTLDDQPVGLLKYLNDFRGWFLQKLGQDRDSSYEISNLGVFDPRLSSEPNEILSAPHHEKRTWNISRVLFSQPANVTASPLNFQVVTRKGAEMVLTLSWQIGVLGASDENAFTADVMANIKDGFSQII